MGDTTCKRFDIDEHAYVYVAPYTHPGTFSVNVLATITLPVTYGLTAADLRAIAAACTLAADEAERMETEGGTNG